MREGNCPEWCEEDHPEPQVLEHRSRAVEIPSTDPECLLFVRVETCFENGDWNEVVSIGRRGEDGIRLTAGNAARVGLALMDRANSLATLNDDSAAVRLVLGLAAQAARERLTVQVRRVRDTVGERPAEIRYPDRDTVVIAFREDCISAEAVAELEALLPGLVAGKSGEGEEEPDRRG
jgi:hypothetical protein